MGTAEAWCRPLRTRSQVQSERDSHRVERGPMACALLIVTVKVSPPPQHRAARYQLAENYVGLARVSRAGIILTWEVHPRRRRYPGHRREVEDPRWRRGITRASRGSWASGPPVMVPACSGRSPEAADGIGR
jgi:hypothetical protein